jgi:SAM-dependent methyltransferase
VALSKIQKATITVYDRHAGKFAARTLTNDRTGQIDMTFALAGNPKDAVVFDLGCGDAPDASYILGKTNHYSGIDASASMVTLARARMPAADVRLGDMTTYEYPKDADIIFAFASLVHLDKLQVTQVLAKVNAALKPGGIFFLSFKASEGYGHVIQKDSFGERIFYLYSPELIGSLAGGLINVSQETFDVRGRQWARMWLKKAPA